jgi:hypothetical protein
MQGTVINAVNKFMLWQVGHGGLQQVAPATVC